MTHPLNPRLPPTPPVTPLDGGEDAALDGALAAALAPPGLPAGFHARLEAARLAEWAAGLARQRQAIDDEHRRALARLQTGYLRLRRETLAVLLAVAFTAGTAVALAAPWVRDTLGLDLSLLLPLAALALGAAAGAAVWVQRLGWPSLPSLGALAAPLWPRR